ncbi:MAG: sigma-54 dependent transcriptional regulator [Planctomycetota bacterium]
MRAILIADPDPETAAALAGTAHARGFEILRTQGADHTLEYLETREIDLLVADWHLPGLCGLELFAAARARSPETSVVMTAAFGNVEDAVDALKAGVRDFLCKPFTAEQLDLAVDRALAGAALVRENRTLRRELETRVKLDRIVSADARMLQIQKTVQAVAATRTTVLLTGESGTGKTLLARAIHRASDRATGPFIEVNCGALPESLLESELFGHVRGAFTGAVRDRAGKFEEASGGTIFLDEIGTASAGLQVRLLRVLQDRVVERVGDSRSIPVDVRVLLATNLDLASEVRAGRFREDLYYRVHVVTVEMPPLRARRADIPLLAEHFLERFRKEATRPIRGFTRAALARLESASWPGNVRQLEHVVERAVVLGDGAEIDLDDLPSDLDTGLLGESPAPESLVAPGAHLLPLKVALEVPERTLIERALQHFHGNRELTAESLGINRSTLFSKMKRLRITGARSQDPATGR